MTHGRLLPNRLQYFEAIMPWKVQIQHNDAGAGLASDFSLAMDELKRALSVGYDFDIDGFFEGG